MARLFTVALAAMAATVVIGVAVLPLATVAAEPGLPCISGSSTSNTISYRGCSFAGTRSQPEQTARAFLETYAAQLGLGSDSSDLELQETRHGIANTTTRFIQTIDGLPVHDVWVSVTQGADGRVRAFYSSYKSEAHSHHRSRQTTAVGRKEAEAVAIGRAAVESFRGHTDSELVWFARPNGALVLAWRVLVLSRKPLGDFLTLVDADSAKVLAHKNLIVFSDTGSGYAYVPNPMQTSGTMTLTDNDDLAGGTLDSERQSVTLLGLETGSGLLKGEYADLTLAGGLGATQADEADRQYFYDRDDPRFEQVVVYHSIDSIQRYIHGLGFDDDVGLANGIRDFPSKANAHEDDNDNAFYSPGADTMHFGDGGVDDGEDADVVAHEYGHAIQHDQNSAWGGGETGAMGEGFGDYLAASFYAGAGDVAYQSAHAACVAEWDAVSYGDTFNPPPCLRRVDGNKIYPDDLTGEVHDDGEIWARALWDIRTALGATAADTIVLEHHFSVPSNATMKAAALEMIAVDGELYGGAGEIAIREAFCDRGILSNNECPILALDLQTTPPEIEAGTTASYQLTATNRTGKSLSGVVISASVPAGSTYVVGSASHGGIYQAAQAAVSWPALAMGPGDAVSYSFAVVADDGAFSTLILGDDMETASGLWTVSHGSGLHDWEITDGVGFIGITATTDGGADTSQALGPAPCTDGLAAGFTCSGVDLGGWLPIANIGGGEGSDIWGWTDPQTGQEWAIMGRSTGTSFIDVSDPDAPVYAGDLPTHSSASDWRDIKVYADHAFIVSEAGGHGMQIFNLGQLRSLSSPPVTFTETAHYDGFSTAHNIAINTDTAYAYAVGTNTCSGGLHIIDISSPTAPASAGCYGGDGYTHDVQCVVYNGPDTEHVGKEVCFASNEDTLTVVDLSDKANPVMLSRTGYTGVSYTHQAWLSQDHTWLLVGDEGDEAYAGHNTRTYTVDLSDLDAPVFTGSYTSNLASIDHNLYIHGGYAYQANYTAGLRILDLSAIATGGLCEVAYLDVYPDNDAAQYEGAWSNYPFFQSGTVVVSSMEGLAVTTPRLDSAECLTGGGPSTGGRAWFASDPDVISDQYLGLASAVVVGERTTLGFWHSYDTESGYDGAVVEISTDGGVNWSDLGESMTGRSYDSSISSGYNNPIGGRPAFHGNSGGYVETSVDLSAWAGQSALLRFRMATDQTVSGFGWAVDNVELSNSVLLTSTATALSDQGYSGSAEARTEVTEPGTACGDGIVAGTNQCDDGNTADGDGCSATCQVEQCYVCSGQPSLCSATDGASCNDGLFCNGADTCSGNQCIIHDGDPCAGMAIDQCGGTCNETRNSCFEAAGQACTSDNDPCTLDGCDGAGSCIHTPVTSCSTTTTTITTTTTSTTTTTIVDVCESAVCGDGTVTADCEVCDDGNTTGGDGCSANCLSDETCGNGYVDTLAGEVCDDSNNDNTDTCLNDCTAASCGDGIVNLQQVPNSDYTGTEIPFDWLDVSAQDTELYLNDDDVSSALSLGFDFDFYGNRYSRTYVSSNGFITFDETSDSGCCDGDSLPNSQAPNNLIAAYWTDLNPLSGGRYSYAQLPGVFVVEAKDVPLFFFQSTLLNSFQYQLYENSSRIELHYLSVVEEWDATAGIEDATGSSGEQHYAGQTALSSYAIAYQIDVALEQCDDGNTTGGDGCSASCQIEVSTPQSKPQQRCINALNKSGAKVARIQDKENATCIKDAWKGRIDNPQTCLSQDRRGKLAKARQKTIRMETAKCTETPDLGYVGSAVVNTATVAARTGLLADLLGPNLDTTVSPSSLRGKCQANMAKAMGKVSVAMDKAFLSCKKKGMRSGLIISQNTLGACLDAVTVDTRGRIARAMSRATRVLDNNCAQDDQAASFAGTCAQAADFVTCAGQRGSCRLCSMFKAMDDLATDCDLYDDGLANVSCP